MSEITVEDLKKKVNECFEKQSEYKKKKRESDDAYNSLNIAKGEAVAMLQELDLPSFKSDMGEISYEYRESFKTPKTVDSKKALRDYIINKYGDDAFWSLFSINSRSLQTFAKGELVEAEDRDDFNFDLPGCERSTTDPIAKLKATSKL